MPLASVGGTEMVHLDVLRALKKYQPKIFIRYSANVWKGKIESKTHEAKLEGKALMSDLKKYGSVTFLDRYLEAARFGRIIKDWYTRKLINKINHSQNPIVIFWHRESIEFLIDDLESHVKIIDIVHNNSNDIEPDASYLVNDWVPRLNKRILVSEGLKKWLKPLYKDSGYSETFWARLNVIEHSVGFPKEGFIQKPSDKFNVLFVGRDVAEKQFHLILQIAENLFEQNTNFQFHFIGPQKTHYAHFNLANCSWYGTLTDREEIEKIYNKSHVLIMTSSSEGFPKVISEAMAFSCVPIVTNVGDISSHVKPEFNGILTQPKSCIEESCLALIKLKDNKELFLQLSQNSYLYAKEKFTEERFKNEWLNVIESLG